MALLTFKWKLKKVKWAMYLSPHSFSVLFYQTRLFFLLLPTPLEFSVLWNECRLCFVSVWSWRRPLFSNPRCSRSTYPTETMPPIHLSYWTLLGLHCPWFPPSRLILPFINAFLSWILRNYTIQIFLLALQAMLSFSLFFTDSLTSLGPSIRIMP